MIDEAFGLEEGFTRAAKNAEEADFCGRLNLEWDSPLALN